MFTNTLGKPEHPGRLRGFSGFTSQRKIYGKQPRRRTSHAECMPKAEVQFLPSTFAQACSKLLFLAQIEKMIQSFSKQLEAMRDQVRRLEELLSSQCSQAAAATPPHASTAMSSHCGSAPTGHRLWLPLRSVLYTDLLSFGLICTTSSAPCTRTVHLCNS